MWESSKRDAARRRIRFGGARVAIVLLCLLLQVGCLTERVLDKYRAGRPLKAARLEVVEASPSSIRLSWEISYEGSRVRSGVMSFDPLLPDCEQVDVFLRDSRDVLQVEPGKPHTVNPAVSPLPVPRPLGRCDVVIFARIMSSADLALYASSTTQDLGEAAVQGPRNSWWLAAVPATALADTTVGAVRVIGFLGAMVAISIAQSDTPTTWTWTP